VMNHPHLYINQPELTNNTNKKLNNPVWLLL
jgi:hypothetical protein